MPHSVVRTGFSGPYDRKGLYDLRSIFDNIRDDDTPVYFDGDPIDMSSSRYKVFSRSVVCAKCHLRGSFFAKERSAKRVPVEGVHRREWPQVAIVEPYHFNLYGMRGGEDVLFTKDHIIPRVFGGADVQFNYRTMCSPCNGNRGSKMNFGNVFTGELRSISASLNPHDFWLYGDIVSNEAYRMLNVPVKRPDPIQIATTSPAEHVAIALASHGELLRDGDRVKLWMNNRDYEITSVGDLTDYLLTIDRTIDAIAVDPTGKIIDPYFGLRDITRQTYSTTT